MRYLSTFFVVCCFTFSKSESDLVKLETGNYFLDTVREVELNQFPYIYSIKQVLARGMIIELQDGSLWQVEEMTPESKSFFAQRNPEVDFKFVEELVENWQPDDNLIFHKLVERESLLIYNMDRDMLIDAVPLLPPLEPMLKIEMIDWGSRQIILNDHSIWSFTRLCKCKNWKKDDPILVAKNTPWGSGISYVLINLSPCICDSKVEHIHPSRLEAMPATKVEVN